MADEEKTDQETKFDEDEIVALETQSFNAGFDEGMGDVLPDEETLESAEPQEPEQDADEEKAAVKATEAIEKLTKQVQSLQGAAGSVKQQIEQGVQKALEQHAASTPAPTAGPTDEEVKVAMANEEAMSTLMEDYPAFAPVAEALKAMREALAGQNSVIDSKIAESEQRLYGKQQQKVQESKQEQEQQALNDAHSDWMDIVQSDEFKTFALEDGPSIEDYDHVSQLMGAAQAEGKTSQEADNALNAWTRQHPDWWAKKGVKLFGDTSSSIEILDQYRDKDKPATPVPDDLEAERRKKRIASTTTVRGKSGRATVKNDNDAFSSGFDKIHRKS